MFRKRIKKEFPEGTFLEIPKRILAIIQLCFAFTVILTWIGHPFLGELFEIKNRKLLHSAVMDQKSSFTQLSLNEIETIKKYENTFKDTSKRSFLEKTKNSFKLIFIKMPPFKKAWLLFSIILPIMLLLKMEGAALACWLLPIIMLVHIVDYQGKEIVTTEADLFPKEDVLVVNYLKKPLGGNIEEERKDLLKAWNLYLIEEWAQTTPSKNIFEFENQKNFGLLRFNIARMEAQGPLKNGPSENHLWVLWVYFLWSVFFSWRMNKKVEASHP